MRFYANECNERETLTPNPNEWNSTLTSGTKNIYPTPIDVKDRGHRFRSGSPVTNYPCAAPQCASQHRSWLLHSHAFTAILWGPFLLKKALFSETEKCHCFPCSSIIYRHLMFSTSHFKGSLSTILIKSVNAMPLWDFLQSHFEVVFKIITIAELFIVVTTSPG